MFFMLKWAHKIGHLCNKGIERARSVPLDGRCIALDKVRVEKVVLGVNVLPEEGCGHWGGVKTDLDGRITSGSFVSCPETGVLGVVGNTPPSQDLLLIALGHSHWRGVDNRRNSATMHTTPHPHVCFLLGAMIQVPCSFGCPTFSNCTSNFTQLAIQPMNLSLSLCLILEVLE